MAKAKLHRFHDVVCEELARLLGADATAVKERIHVVVLSPRSIMIADHKVEGVALDLDRLCEDFDG